MLTLPAGHSRAERDLARRIANRFDSEDLHVFWTGTPFRAPRAKEELPLVGVAIAAIGAFLESLTSTLTSLGRSATRS